MIEIKYRERGREIEKGEGFMYFLFHDRGIIFRGRISMYFLSNYRDKIYRGKILEKGLRV